jgi:HD-like signal output (HDOD) protein
MRRVLFVDDEPRILDGLRRMLRPQREEWEMAFAPGGEAALALLDAHPFDVIVSDMRMPGLDGAALLHRVRDQYPQIVRIVLTGQTEMSTTLRVVPVAHQFLAKPCDAGVLRVAIERACHLQSLLNDDAIRRNVGAMGDLPSLARTYHELTHALTDPDVSLQTVARIVEHDVGISARILQLVNSAFFGLSNSITNVQSAISYLGIATLKNLVLSVEVFRVFQPKRVLRGFSLEGVQYHSRLTAHIAARLPVPRHLTDTVFVAGMLHDVGKLILAAKLSERFENTLAEAEKEHCPLYKVEEREGGFSHAEIGAYLLGLWGLPYTVVEAVAFHHTANQMAHQDLDAVSAVHVADLLAHEIEEPPPEQGLEVPAAENREAEFEALGVVENLAEWRAMAAGIPALLAEACYG